MTFIIDKSAYRTACLYAACGYEVIARLYLKKHMVGNYELIKKARHSGCEHQKPSNWLVYRKHYLNITTNWTISNLKLFALLFMTLLAKFMIGPKKKRKLL